MKKLSFLCVGILISLGYFCNAQSIDSVHNGGGIQWNANSKTCNVCHAPFNLKQTPKQPSYYNHMVNSTSGKSKVDKNFGDTYYFVQAVNFNSKAKCLNCHAGTEKGEYLSHVKDDMADNAEWYLERR